MDELTQIPSRLGQVSTIIAVLDLLIGGLLVSIFFLLPVAVIDQIRIIYTLGFLAFFIFPIVAILGLILSGVAFLQPYEADFYKMPGLALNGFNLLLWVGIIFYQITFNAQRFRI